MNHLLAIYISVENTAETFAGGIFFVMLVFEQFTLLQADEQVALVLLLLKLSC